QTRHPSKGERLVLDEIGQRQLRGRAPAVDLAENEVVLRREADVNPPRDLLEHVVWPVTTLEAANFDLARGQRWDVVNRRELLAEPFPNGVSGGDLRHGIPFPHRPTCS